MTIIKNPLWVIAITTSLLACGGESVSSSSSSSSGSSSSSSSSSSASSSSGGGVVSTLTLQENEPGLCRVDGDPAENSNNGFSGDGYANVDNATGKRIVWRVDAATAGQYQLEVRFANGGTTARSGELFINVGSSYSLQLPATNAWSSWQTETVTVNLRAGQNTLALAASGSEGLANIDYLSLNGTGELTPGNCSGLQSNATTFSAAGGLFNNGNADTLGLNYPAGIVNSTAYYGQAGLSQYNHGAVLMPFKGKLYLQWQSSIQDEDAADTVVRFSSSSDGDNWSDAQVLVPARNGYTVTNGGWWTDGNTLVAYINVWPQNLSPRGGYAEYITSTDGINWSAPARVKMANGSNLNGVIEQDVKALPNGRLLTAVHTQPGLVIKPFYTDDPLGISGWQQGQFTNASFSGDVSNELEPSWYLKADGSLVMVFRDQASSYRILAATSADNGVSWSAATATNMPDSRAKQSAGNLPDGTAFIVNNPSGTSTRLPLTVTLSEFGNAFNRAFLLHGGEILPPMRYEGLYKRIGYSYPKSVVWNGYLWVSYGINKEDIGVTRVPVTALDI